MLDDIQLYIHLFPGNCANSFHQLKACLNDILTWMFEKKLKFHPEKSEFIVFGSTDRYKWLKDFSLSISLATVSLQLILFTIWVYYLTQNLVSLIKSILLSNPVLLTCMICIILDAFCPFMSRSWLQMNWSVLVWIIAILCFSLSSEYIAQGARISKIVWHALLLVLSDLLVTPTLKSLHWLLVKQRIIFKIRLLLYAVCFGWCVLKSTSSEI